MNFLIFRDFFKKILNFSEFKIDFINQVGEVKKCGASNQIAIVDPGKG